MTAEEYATNLAVASVPVIAAVHRGDDSHPFVKAALALAAPAGVNKAEALYNVLAAQVNPDTSLTERLMWCEPSVQAACRGAA